MNGNAKRENRGILSPSYQRNERRKMSDAIRSQVSEFLSEKGIAFAAVFVGAKIKRDTDPKGWECDEWRVSLTREGRKIETAYYTGTGQRKQVKPMPQPPYRKGTIAYEEWAKTAFKEQAPHAADVLHSLTLDAEAIDQSFADWADNFGYDSDSIKARNTYDACCAIGQQLRAMFSREEMDTLREMLQDY